MGKSHKLVVIYGILTKTSDRDAHAMLIIYIQSYLRTVILF